MSARVCKALGYGISWLVVGVVFALFGVGLWASFFTNLMLLFAIIALFEGKGKEWLNGRFAASKWQSMIAELVVTVAIYTPIALLFGLHWGDTISFWVMLLACLCAGAFAPFAGKLLEGFTSSGTRG